MQAHALLFGNTGALGTSIQHQLLADGYELTVVNRGAIRPDFVTDGTSYEDFSRWVALERSAPFDVVVWAHGINTNDNIESVSISELERLFEVNVSLIVSTCNLLIVNNLIAAKARVCVVSSIWEILARPGKLSYTISKSAVGGLIRALSSELAKLQVVVNGVLPGVVDTPMTRSMLTSAQISEIQRQTPGGRLVTVDDVASAVSLLCSDKNTCITGQSIRLDNGFSHTRMF